MLMLCRYAVMPVMSRCVTVLKMWVYNKRHKILFQWRLSLRRKSNNKN